MHTRVLLLVVCIGIPTSILLIVVVCILYTHGYMHHIYIYNVIIMYTASSFAYSSFMRTPGVRMLGMRTVSIMRTRVYACLVCILYAYILASLVRAHTL